MTDRERVARETAAVFGRAAPTYDTVIPFFAHFGALLVERARLEPGETVLDIGSGRGASALRAAESVGDQGRVVATDLSFEMVVLIEQTRDRRGLTNLTAVVADAHDLGFDGGFDVVLSGAVLHLVPDPAAMAASIHRALRPDGRFVVSYPTGGGERWNFFGNVLRSFARRAARPLDPPPASPPDLLTVLREAGFEDLASTEESGDFVFEDEHEWWRWVWSTGMRGRLEAFDDDVLNEVRAEMLREVAALGGPGGIPLHQTVRFISGRRAG
ncbi:MAG: class I SAM-dependent methyltransferase [Actinomycetota bacterium]